MAGAVLLKQAGGAPPNNLRSLVSIANSKAPIHPPIRKNPRKAIIFDIDGVLVDSRLQTANALQETLRQAGIRIDEKQALQAVEAGHDAKSIVACAFPQVKEAPSLWEELSSKLVAISTEFLDALQPSLIAKQIPDLACCFSLAVATNRAKHSAQLILEKIGVLRHFSAIVSLDDAPPKPSPQMILLALQRLKVEASEAVFVGDKKSDKQAGDGAGVHTIMVNAAKGVLGCLPFFLEFLDELKNGKRRW